MLYEKIIPELTADSIARLAARSLNDLIGALDRHRVDLHPQAELFLYRAWIDANTPASPWLFAAWFNLGAAHARIGEHDDAIAAFSNALAVRPDFVQAAWQLGLQYDLVGQSEAAIAAFTQAATLAPDMAVAHYKRANLLVLSGRLDEAAEPVAQAAQLDPTNPLIGSLVARMALHDAPFSVPTWHALFAACSRAGRPDLAATALAHSPPIVRQSLAIRVAFGEMYQRLRDFDNAAAAFAEATRLTPEPALVWRMLGHVLAVAGRIDEAEHALGQAERLLREAVQAQPDSDTAWSNYAIMLYEQGRPEEGVACLTKVLRDLPDSTKLAGVHGVCLIAAGRELEGWPAYNGRAIDEQPIGRPHPAPPWDGTPAPDQTVLLTSDDGYGDGIQFCRFATIAAGRARIVLQVQPALLRLVRTLPGPDQVVSMAEAEPVPADFRCSLRWIAGVLAPTLSDLPADIPYLHADPAEAAKWRAQLAHLSGMRVGMVWHGNSRLNWDDLRSVPLERLTRLADTPGISFVSLQVGGAAPDWMYDPTPHLHDFADTAALVSALDLVITIDSAVAHLAGALARPVWLLNRFSAEMRWQARREDCPWYPTMRQFRQLRPGDWDEVLERVHQVLRNHPTPQPFR